MPLYKFVYAGFNSQPLEGGCPRGAFRFDGGIMFQLTAARRRLHMAVGLYFAALLVSTHSRSKAAASSSALACCWILVSTHSRSKAAAEGDIARQLGKIGFNSQPLEGGCQAVLQLPTGRGVSTHSRSKAAAWARHKPLSHPVGFQLTAARRRLRAAWH